jgi:hypothetical protein
MKKYYIIYECDSHRSYSSFTIKSIYTNKTNAIKHYNACISHYKTDDNWFLNVAEYQQDDSARNYKACTNNLFFDLEHPFLTTEFK